MVLLHKPSCFANVCKIDLTTELLQDSPCFSTIIGVSEFVQLKTYEYQMHEHVVFEVYRCERSLELICVIMTQNVRRDGVRRTRTYTRTDGQN